MRHDWRITLVLLLASHLCSAQLPQHDYDRSRFEALRQLRDLLLTSLEEMQRESAGDVVRKDAASMADIAAGARELSSEPDAEYSSSQRPKTSTTTAAAASRTTWMRQTTSREHANGTIATGVLKALWFQHLFHGMLKLLPLAAWIAIFSVTGLITLALLILCIICCYRKAKCNNRWRRLGDELPQTLRYNDLDIMGKDQPPYGTIHFSLEYDVPTCQLTVTVSSCTGLPKNLKDLDPYVVINISPAIHMGDMQAPPPYQNSSGIATEHSKVVKASVNPAFNYTRVFKIKEGRQLKNKVITFEVYDWDIGTRHRMIARRVLNLLKLGEKLNDILGRTMEYSRNLKPGINQEATGPGDICLSLCYSSLERHLWINVIECKGVFIQKMERPEFETMPNTYVKLSVTMAGSAKRTTQYTDTIKDSRNPYFNKQFVFKLEPQHMQVACLRVTLVHRTETLRIKRIIGALTLSRLADKDSLALLHWREVLQNFDRPSSRWHTLTTPEAERKQAERKAAAERKKLLELAEEKDLSSTAAIATNK